ncbi:MAG: LptE family protein [Bacteroidota bacterium]|nr:LptE family protein [Bacteroidota bacterium]
MKKIIFSIIILIATFQSCTVSYTLSGASIAPEVKTVSVQYFTNRAPLAMSNIGQYITDELKDKFKSQTSLTLVNDVGHLNFEGEITKYDTKPMAIVGDETAAQNRLSVTVHVKFTNEIEPEYNFDSDFSRYADYDSNLDLAQVEQELVEEIVEQLIDDIFNKSVVNW